jgi:hypothetical protein
MIEHSVDARQFAAALADSLMEAGCGFAVDSIELREKFWWKKTGWTKPCEGGKREKTAHGNPSSVARG